MRLCCACQIYCPCSCTICLFNIDSTIKDVHLLSCIIPHLPIYVAFAFTTQFPLYNAIMFRPTLYVKINIPSTIHYESTICVNVIINVLVSFGITRFSCCLSSIACVATTNTAQTHVKSIMSRTPVVPAIYDAGVRMARKHRFLSKPALVSVHGPS